MKDIPDSHEVIKSRVAQGILYFGFGRIISQFILTSTNLLLLRILTPEVFGIFSIISFLTVTLGTVTTLGLGPALIQYQAKVKTEHLRAIFTVLIFISLLFVMVIYMTAPLIDILYKGALGPTGIFWLRVFSLTQLLGHAASISMFSLQRNLEYTKFTYGDIISKIIAQLLIVILAISGWGIGSFVLGTLIGQVIAFGIFFYLYPWRIGFTKNLTQVRIYLPFGANYVVNSVIGIVNAAVIPGFVGIVSGPTAVGLINWAGGIRQTALIPFEVIEKLLFPAASRSQNDLHLLKGLLEKMLKFSCLLSFPLLAILIALAPAFISILFTSKWLPGLLVLYISLLQGIFFIFNTLLTDVLMAFGKIDKVRNISFLWVLLQWILTVPLVLLWNYNGAVLASCLVSATFIIPLQEVRKIITFEFSPQIVPYLLYSVFTAGVLKVLTWQQNIQSFWQLVVYGSIGAFTYALLLFFFKRNELIADSLILKNLLFKPKIKPI